MMHTALFRLLFSAGLTIILAGSACWNCPALAANASPTPNATQKSKIPKGRLPPYYAKVVTAEQREKIYAIQDEYRTKIESARAQLDALLKDQKDRISAVLTDEQKKKLDALQTAAKSNKSEEKTVAPKNGKTLPLDNPAELEKDK
jgi:hypothetical protein